MYPLHRTVSLVAPLSLVLSSTMAEAQTAQGFALNRFDPSERGSEWFALESLDLRGDWRPAAGIVFDYSHKPLVLYAPDGSERKLLVKDQLFLHVGGGIIVANRFRLSLNLPIAVYQGGEQGTLGTTTYAAPSSAGVGDLRIGADVRLVGEYGGPFTLAFGAQLHAPTGKQSDYTGDGKVRVVPRLLSAGDIGGFVYAVKVGAQYRALEQTFANSPTGTEFVFGAAAGLRAADGKLVVGPEVYGSTVVSQGDAAFKKQSTPVEFLVGAHYTVSDFRLGAGVGPGLTRGFGTPALRGVLAFEWIPAIVPATPPSDRDQDGILDTEDACPDAPGVRTTDPKTNGCPPPPPDRDKDGIVDAEDACPDTPGPKNEDPKKNGCPAARV
ncbi:MAG TPA: transporter, partial [Polyangiaceae bacterium]|nr:transporter [Polyangiaceae bacterium]